MDDMTKRKVKDQIVEAMERMITKRTVKEPFNEGAIAKNNPFGYRIVPMEVWKGAKFERSFVTTLGQGIFEQIGRIIAKGSGAFAENQYSRKVTLNTFKTETIDTIIGKQRTKKEKKGTSGAPDLNQELQHLMSLHNAKYEDVVVLSDLYVRRQGGQEEFYSFKTVKPNIDQTAEAKKNLLLLRSGEPSCEAYFALPYNPAGEWNSYKGAKHSIPNKLFDMDDLDFVLIGSNLWNKIGNDQNTFKELLEIFDLVGQSSKLRIQQDYFGIK